MWWRNCQNFCSIMRSYSLVSPFLLLNQTLFSSSFLKMIFLNEMILHEILKWKFQQIQNFHINYFEWCFCLIFFKGNHFCIIFIMLINLLTVCFPFLNSLNYHNFYIISNPSLYQHFYTYGLYQFSTD